MELSVLRIYMTISAKVDSDQLTFWQRLFNNSLSVFLLKKAREAGVEQAIIQRIPGGYLKGKQLAFDMSEVAPPNLPQCLELIDEKEKLVEFVAKNRKQLDGCKVVLFNAVEVLK